MDLNTAIKDNWQEANEAQGSNLNDVCGRYSEENDCNTEMSWKSLQLVLIWIFMSILKEVVENRIEDSRGSLIRLIKYTDGEAREL